MLRYLFLALLLMPGSVFAADPFSSADEDYIPTLEEAFVTDFHADMAQENLQVRFSLWEHVYLYQHRFSFRLVDENGNLLNDFADVTLPPGKHKVDEIFGDVEVYYHEVTLDLPLAHVPLVPATLEVDFQGCLEDVLCYPPSTRSFALPVVTGESAAAAPVSANTSNDNDFFATLSSQDANAFNDWMAGHGLGMIVLLFFAGGLLLAFTPCVFPMIPILSGIIAGSDNPSAMRGFTLSVAYVLGVAIPYTIAGLLVGLFGAGMNLQYLLQQPAAVITSAVVFLILSLSMFGLYELQLPAALRDRLNSLGNQRQGGSFLGAAILGAISALVVSPCVTPILAGALVYVAGTGDAATGAASLFALSIGMGVPLILVGTGGGHILPRAGAWMEEVKRFFGVLMLGVAVWLAGRLLDNSLVMGLYGLLMAAYGVYLGALEPVGADGSRARRALAAVIALYGTILIVGAASGGDDPLQPLARAPAPTTVAANMTDNAGSAEAHAGWRTVVGRAQLDAALAEASRAGRPVLVDFFAEWCVACKVLEEETLTEPRVLDAMADWTLIRADITEITAENQAIMAHWNIVGLPCLVFIGGDGEEVPGARILGEMGPDRFLKHLNTKVTSGI
ncbi:MAG: protein-disulfide reductase DsbD [Alcanivoracaceae bacterium]|nr:protein-disulfide reductase DsbD [Alcanivoracaceae bacterium]